MIFGIYIHIPFCRQGCKYCHFVTIPHENRMVDKYRDAVVQEIKLYSESCSEVPEVDSIYIGGGTPSLLPAEYLISILDTCRTAFSVSEDCEISIEVNPDSVRDDRARIYRQEGINRISVGVQSLDDGELAAIGRTHDAVSVQKALGILRSSSLNNISVDLLLGLPSQTPESWRETLSLVSEMDVKHISVYMLDLDEPCELADAVSNGSVSIPEDDCVAETYLDTLDFLSSRGFDQYEISNFAKPAYRCRHNMKYWHRDPVIGFGLASHSFDGILRYSNYTSMEQYLHSLDSGRLPVEHRYPVGEKQKLEEHLFLGLRMNEGINWRLLKENYRDERLVEFEESLRKLDTRGLVRWNGPTVRLTPEGMLLSNEILQMFV